MTEYGYVIAIGVDLDRQIAKKELIISVEDYQKLGYEAVGNLTITVNGFFNKVYRFEQAMVKKAKLKGVNC